MSYSLNIGELSNALNPFLDAFFPLSFLALGLWMATFILKILGKAFREASVSGHMDISETTPATDVYISAEELADESDDCTEYRGPSTCPGCGGPLPRFETSAIHCAYCGRVVYAD